MKKHVIELTAMVALAAAMASPANAGHGELEVAARKGPTYVQHNNVYRLIDRHRHYDRDHRPWRKHQKRHRKHHRRWAYEHDLWHWYNDYRWDRYYDFEHRELHRDLRLGHHDFHRKRGRPR
jgi:hypothetical protein